MSDHPPPFHNRRSIRLKGYDYSRAGLYFITLCVQNRERLFGEIRPVEATVETPVEATLRGRLNITTDNKSKYAPIGSRRQMILNDAGKMIEKWYAELENKYPNIRRHEFVVMPNHFHCIVEITDAVVSEWDAHVGAPLRGRTDGNNAVSPYGPHNKKYNPVIGDAVGWFKTMTTNEYIRGVKNHGWTRFDGKLWQRNYWEHIIRDQDSYGRIAEYIIRNPDKWDEDQFTS